MHLFAAVDACRGSQADAVYALRTHPTEPGHLAFYPAAFVRAPLPLRPIKTPVRVSNDGDLVSTLACGYTKARDGRLVPVGLQIGRAHV